MSSNVTPTHTATNSIMMSRKTNSSPNFRAGYYAKLGIFPSAPKSTTTTTGTKTPPPILRRQSSSLSTRSSATPPSPPCLRHKRSVLHTTAAQNERVSFNPEVKLYRIKHHNDYSDDEWNKMWIGCDALDYEKDRNTLEYVSDGNDWRNATEEDNFQEGPDGTLMHPATYIAYRYHWERYGFQEGKKPVIDFRSLLKEAPRRGWSPRPAKQQRKSFWLFELAMESVQKGKQAAGHRRQANLQQHHLHVEASRHGDRGFP